MERLCICTGSFEFSQPAHAIMSCFRCNFKQKMVAAELLWVLDDPSICFVTQGTGGRGGGGTLIFSYISRLGSFFWFKILNFNILGVFRKMNIFWGMEILKSSQNKTIFRDQFYAF